MEIVEDIDKAGIAQTPSGWTRRRAEAVRSLTRHHPKMISLRTELDWDYYPATTKPPDYARHRVVLELRAAVVFAR